MARLPQSIDLQAPRGERASLDVVKPTDGGLGAVARGLADVGESLAQVQRVRDVEQAKRQEQQDQIELAKRQADFLGRDLAADAAWRQSEDGSTPGASDRRLAGYTAAAQAEIDATPEPLRARNELFLTQHRIGVTETAMDFDRKISAAHVLNGANSVRDTLVNGVTTNPLGYDAAIAQVATTAAALPADVREAYVRDGSRDVAAAALRGRIVQGDYAGVAKELGEGAWDNRLSPEDRARLSSAAVAAEQQARGAAADRVRDALAAVAYGATPDVVQLRKDALLSGDGLLETRVDYYAQTGQAQAEADRAGTGQVGATGLDSAIDFIIDVQEGGDAYVADDNGKGPTRFGVNSQANPGVNVATLTRTQARSIFINKYAKPLGVDRMPDDLAFAVTDIGVNMGVPATMKLVEQSQGDVGRFLSLAGQRYKTLSAQQPKNAATWARRFKNTVAETARRTGLLNRADGLSSDPMGYARGSDRRAPLYDVAPLPIGREGTPEWAAALQARVSTGRRLFERQKTKMTVLDSAEAEHYKDMLDRDPNVALSLTKAAVAAIGPESTKVMLGQIGAKGAIPAFLHLADLSASDRGSTFAVRAVKGLALRASGAKLAPPEGSGRSVAQVLDDAGPLFADQGSLRVTVQQVAEAAQLFDQNEGHAQRATNYVNAALGALSIEGRTYGGITTVNKRPVILPRWMSADHADEALETLADIWANADRGPVYTNGKPMPAHAVARLTPQYMKNGTWRLLDGNTAVLGRNGRPFVVNLDGAKAVIRQRLGRAAVAEGR